MYIKNVLDMALKKTKTIDPVDTPSMMKIAK